MTDVGGQTKRDRQRERAESRREAARRAQQRRNLGYGAAGVVLIAVVVIVVVALMGGDEGGGGGQPATVGDVTVQGAPRAGQLEPGETIPSFTAPDLLGGTVAWSDYAGRPAVLSVWAHWCGHCQAELPIVDRVMRDYPGVGWVTITTSIDPTYAPSPEEYLQQNELDFPVAVDDEQGTLAAAFGIEYFPTLYFANSDGTVGAAMTGEVDEATLRATIDALA